MFGKIKTSIKKHEITIYQVTIYTLTMTVALLAVSGSVEKSYLVNMKKAVDDLGLSDQVAMQVIKNIVEG